MILIKTSFLHNQKTIPICDYSDLEINTKNIQTFLMDNEMYKSIVGLLTSINRSVENSYKCIEVLMIYFNSKIGEELSRYNRGIYRYCTIKDINDKKVPEDLQNYM